jgi:hypothetical protein
MGLFDSTSSSETTNTSQNAGFSEIAGAASSLNLVTGKKTKNVTVNALDGGAIGSAFGFAGEALRESLKQVELAGASARGTTQDTISALAAAARSEPENIAITLGKWALIAAIAYFGFRAIRG